MACSCVLVSGSQERPYRDFSQSVSLGDEFNLLDQRQGGGSSDVEATGVCGQRGDGVYSLVSKVLQPLSTDVCIEENSGDSSARQC